MKPQTPSLMAEGIAVMRALESRRPEGQRLIKQTVNFDDPGSYHLYFGDEAGRPGTAITSRPSSRERAPSLWSNERFSIITSTIVSIVPGTTSLSSPGRHPVLPADCRIVRHQ